MRSTIWMSQRPMMGGLNGLRRRSIQSDSITLHSRRLHIIGGSGAPHTAEFEADLIRLRTREGMAVARSRGKLRGKQPKLSDKQQKELRRMHDTGEYSISDLAELFTVSRPTVYRTLGRQQPAI